MKDEKWIDNTKFGFKPVVSTYRSFDEMLASIGKPDESKNKK
jgi:hypothetical protein